MAKPTPLDALKFGLACGMTFGLGLFLLGLIATFSGIWADAISMIGRFYLSYAPTVSGSVIGGLWAFVDGTIGGAIFAWIYNKLLGK